MIYQKVKWTILFFDSDFEEAKKGDSSSVFDKQDEVAEENRQR